MMPPTEPAPQEIQQLLSCFNAADYAAAEALARALTVNYPGHSFGWKALGAVCKLTGRVEESLEPMRQALRLAADDAAAHSNLGTALQALGHAAEAEASFRAAIHLAPAFVEAHFNLGIVLKETGRLDEATDSYREALRLNPQYADAHYNLGIALKVLARHRDAEASLREAIRLRPGHADSHINLGVTLQQAGYLSEAEASFRHALSLQPDAAHAHLNLGVTLKELGRMAEAEASFRAAIRLKPDFAEAHSNLLFCLNYAPAPSNEATLAAAQRFGAMVSAKAREKFTSWHVDAAGAKLRIGFVSGDLMHHPVGYFLEGLLKHLDREKFEVHAFPTIAKSDDFTLRLQPQFYQWTPICGMDDRSAATLIHAQGIQVLIDLSGHTAHNRLPVFSYRPAPVQASWLGYFATTGLPEMDYFLGDRHVSPAHESPHFTETLWNLPETWFCLTPPDQAVSTTGLPALANGHVTFGCFGNLSKMDERVVHTWATILRKIPAARLFLKSKQLADAGITAEVRARFARHGIAAGRLCIEGPASRSEYFAAYRRIDIVLDTFPYPGGTTSVEALWMGVPVLSLKGDRFLSRLGESIAMNAGQAGWIATDLDDYVHKATAFAADLDALARLRLQLRERVLQSPLFDAPRFALHFGEALRGMWRATLPKMPGMP